MELKVTRLGSLTYTIIKDQIFYVITLYLTQILKMKTSFKTIVTILVKNQLLGLITGLILGLIIGAIAMLGGPDNHIAIPMEEFHEAAWRTPNTKGVRVVTSTPFARFEIHQVEVENKDERGVITKKLIPDWLWVDEREHVNILVHLKEENKYLLYRQMKYGLKEPKLAIIGGLFADEEGENDAETCAKRELLEETGLVAEEMKFLGRYRVQVNRGGGHLNIFLARNCVKAPANILPRDFENDLEERNELKLTRQELIDEVQRHEVGEAQWLATILMGLLGHSE